MGVRRGSVRGGRAALALAALVLAAPPVAAQGPSAYMADAWCADRTSRSTDDEANAITTLPHFKVVYAYATDDGDDFAAYADLIQSRTKAIAQALADESGGRKSVRLDLGTSCGQGILDVQVVALDRERAYYRTPAVDGRTSDALERFGKLVGELRRKIPPIEEMPRNYVVWADELFAEEDDEAPAGSANDSSLFSAPGAGNPSNRGEGWAVVWGRGGSDFVAGDANGAAVVAAHEMLHLLGAVLHAARHSDGFGHCTDGYDVMCHWRSGSCSGAPGGLVIDCGDDDYFNPTGAITRADGSEIWNSYDSVFLCPLARCGVRNRPPAAALAASPATARVGEPVSLSAEGSSDDSAIAGYGWDLDGDGSFETSGEATRTATFATPGERTVRVRVTDDEGASAVAEARVEVLDRASGPGSARLTGLRVSPARFRPLRRGGAVASLARGARIRFALSATATVRFGVERAVRGRRVGRRCRAAARGRGRPCTAYRRLRGGFAHAGAAGANTLRFSGRLRGRALPAGRFRLVARPGASGRQGPPARARFQIVR